MSNSVTAFAPATVANQFIFDGGGFSVEVKRITGGEPPDWETLYDEVSIELIEEEAGRIRIENFIKEEGVEELSIDPYENTGGRIIVSILRELEEKNIGVEMKIKKGFSLRGTGLGSSGATPAAALKAFEKAYEGLRGRALPFNDLDKANFLMDADRGVPDNSIPAYFGKLIQIEVKNDKVVGLESIKKHPKFGEFVLITPKGFGIKTSDARAAIRGLSPPSNLSEISQKMKIAMESGDIKAYGEWMELAHEWFVGGKSKTARSRLYPEDGKVYDKVASSAKEAGATGVTISGAGPTMLAVVPSETIGERVGFAMSQAFDNFHFESVARLIDINKEGAKVIN